MIFSVSKYNQLEHGFENVVPLSLQNSIHI